MAESHTIAFECSALSDAIGELARLDEVLIRRHGSEYRQLERQLESVVESDLVSDDLVPLGEGRFAILPHPNVTATLRAARKLGVL